MDATNACAADLNARVDAIGSSAAELSARMGSAESGAASIKADVDGLKTMMAGHADTNRLDPSYAENLDMMLDIRAALAALGERPDNAAAYGAISDGVKANAARIAALEDTINMINSHIAGVAGKLDTVETAVERNVGPAPTTLQRTVAKYDVTFGHVADSAGGKVPTTLTATYTFSCKADVFVGKTMLIMPIPDDTRSAILLGNSVPPQGSGYRSVVTVDGKTLWDTNFAVGTGSGIFYNSSAHDFNLMELKAGRTLDFKTSLGRNYTNGTVHANYILAEHGENVRFRLGARSRPSCLGERRRRSPRPRWGRSSFTRSPWSTILPRRRPNARSSGRAASRPSLQRGRKRC